MRMATINLTIAETDDDAKFVGLLEQIINGAVSTHQPTDVRVFKIDHWFDHKWLGFSGKVLGALGVWRNKLTVPAFVANRIVNQWQYVQNETSAEYQMAGPGPNIHLGGSAAENLHRRRVADCAVVSTFLVQRRRSFDRARQFNGLHPGTERKGSATTSID